MTTSKHPQHCPPATPWYPQDPGGPCRIVSPPNPLRHWLTLVSALTPDQVDAYRKGWSDGTTTFRNYLDGSIDALRHVIPAKDPYEPGAKILPFVLIAGAAATYGLAGLALRRNMFRRNAGLTARLDDLERRLALQIQANGRDQRIELDKLHKALSSIGQNRTLSGPVMRPDLGQGSLAVGGTLESSLRDLEDHVIMANKDRRTELYGFRSELMGELQVIKDEVKGLEGKIMGGLGEKLSAASGMHDAPRWELEEGNREWLEKKGVRLGRAYTAYQADFWDR